jgi:hypothetical protein
MAKKRSTLNAWHWKQGTSHTNYRPFITPKQTHTFMNTNRISEPSFSIIPVKSSIQKKKSTNNNLRPLRLALHAQHTNFERHSLPCESHFVHVSWCSHCRHLWGNCWKKYHQHVYAWNPNETLPFVKIKVFWYVTQCRWASIFDVLNDRSDCHIVTITVWSLYWIPQWNSDFVFKRLLHEIYALGV